jgi:hypothetical protein
MTKTQNLSREPGMRVLRTEELDAVTGGIVDGCIRLPTIVVKLPSPPEPFVDVFAPKLPSWVRPLA